MIEGICMVAEHIFNLIKTLFILVKTKMKFYALGIIIVPLAVVGIETALLLAILFPWRGSKLYYACKMTLHNYASTYCFRAFSQGDPSFLHRPIPRSLSQDIF
jgi:hypothetical protein